MENVENDMTPILLEDLGMKYRDSQKNRRIKQKVRFGLYKCQHCDKEFEAVISQVKGGYTKSCGCKKANGNCTKHTLSSHPLYPIWNIMKQKCNNPKSNHYKNYGGSGIKVCERWLDVGNFIEDMHPSYQEGKILTRINRSKDFEVANCEWVDKTTRARTEKLHKNNTSGFRGVYYNSARNKWIATLKVDKQIYLGGYQTALEAAKAYERYVRINNLEHNFTPILTVEEIKVCEKLKVKKSHK